LSVRAFFSVPSGNDSLYAAIRSGETEFLAATRSRIEGLWLAAHPYLATNAPERASVSFHPEYWELFLAAALLRRGHQLVPTRNRHRDRAPDFEIAPGCTWVEAIAVGPGAGADAVEEGVLGQAREVPDDPIKLRLTAALFQKDQKRKSYLDRQLIQAADPFVVGINAALIPSSVLEWQVPRVVRSVFGVGPQVVSVNVQTGEFSSGGFAPAQFVAKKSGEQIPMTAFLSTFSAGISAIVYSCDDALNSYGEPGDDFVAIHNPMAVNPLAVGSLGCPREYWFDGTVIRVAERA